MPAPRKIKLIKFPPPGQEKTSNAGGMPGGGGDVEASIWLIHYGGRGRVRIVFEQFTNFHHQSKRYLNKVEYVILGLTSSIEIFSWNKVERNPYFCTVHLGEKKLQPCTRRYVYFTWRTSLSNRGKYGGVWERKWRISRVNVLRFSSSTPGR